VSNVGLPQFAIPDGAVLHVLEQPTIESFKEQSYTVPDGETWLLSSVNFAYACSAVAGDRGILLNIKTHLGQSIQAFKSQLGPVTANQQGVVCWALGSGHDDTTIGINHNLYGPLPWLPLPPLTKITTALNFGVDPGDAFDDNTSITYTNWLMGGTSQQAPLETLDLGELPSILLLEVGIAPQNVGTAPQNEPVIL
jgi:hypothetical protein